MFVKIVAVLFTLEALLIFMGRSEFISGVYNTYVVASVMLIGTIILLAPTYLFQSTDENKQKVVYNFQRIIASGLLLEAAGRLGLFQLYKVGFQYDKMIHFLVPAGLVFGIAYLAHIYFNQGIYTSILTGVGMVLIAGIVWEGFEQAADFFFQANTSGINGHFTYIDTVYDLITNTLGITAGALFFWLSAHRKLENK